MPPPPGYLFFKMWILSLELRSSLGVGLRFSSLQVLHQLSHFPGHPSWELSERTPYCKILWFKGISGRGLERASSEGEPMGWGAALCLLFFQAAIVSNQYVVECLVEPHPRGKAIVCPWHFGSQSVMVRSC